MNSNSKSTGENVEDRWILKEKIRPYDPTVVNAVDDALVALQGCSFQGRNLGLALEVLTRMVQDRGCLRVLSMAGAMVPAGMETIVCQLIEKGVIGAIVTTGANITHSIVNVFGDGETGAGQAHFVGSDRLNDAMLNKMRINRIHDTLVEERSFEMAEHRLLDLLMEEFPPGDAGSGPFVLLPSDLFMTIGSHLPATSFLRVAADHGVPVFCGATSDSELGLDLMKFRELHGLQIVLDEIGDVGKFARLVKNYDCCGTIILGGGVPRNWTQQVFPYLQDLHEDLGDGNEKRFKGYRYSVRFHVATKHDGGLSGCTISESISWGKYTHDVMYQSVWGDATVYFPLVITALFQRMEKLGLSKAN